MNSRPRIAYVQTDDTGKPYSISGLTAASGFGFLGYEVRWFKSEEAEQFTMDPSCPVAGGMGVMQRLFDRQARPVPAIRGVPAALAPWLGRDSQRTTLAAVIQEEQFPVFIKPLDQAKLFTGFVAESREAVEALCQPRAGFPAVPRDLPVLAQSPVQFVSEWRVFLIRRTAVGMSHYAGDPLVMPSPGVIRAAINAWTDAPAGCSVDFGVTSDGQTLLVEANDGCALGCGNLRPGLYAELLRARWEEFCGAAQLRTTSHKS